MLSIEFAPGGSQLDRVLPGQEREERQEKGQKGTSFEKMIQKGMTHFEKADNRVDAFFLAL